MAVRALSCAALWFCLYPAEEAVQVQRDGIFRDFFKGLFVIGGNGESEVLAFDLRETEPYSLVAFDISNLNLSESVRPLATSFDAAMDMIGHDTK